MLYVNFKRSISDGPTYGPYVTIYVAENNLFVNDTMGAHDDEILATLNDGRWQVEQTDGKILTYAGFQFKVIGK